MAAFSGPARAMFFGTISPSRTCRITTMVMATRNDTVCSSASGTPAGRRGGQQVRDGGFADPAQHDRTHRDAQLGAGQHDRGSSPARMTVTALRLPGSVSRRSRRAEIRGELGADEERVGRDQQHGEQHREQVAHQAGSSGSGALTFTRSSRSTRRPSIRATRARQRGGSLSGASGSKARSSTVSPSAGCGPERA